MRSIQVIKKNLQLLLRSRGSAMVVLLAPLLIVVIIGIGFSDSGVTTLNVGTHANDNSELTQRYISNLNTTENNIIIFEEEQRCVDSVKEGTIVACIIFPANFVLSDAQTNEVKFYVDESRINLVHRLIATLSFNLNLESEELSQELTTQILQILARSADEVDNSISSLVSTKASTQSSKDKTASSSTSLSNLDVEEVPLDFTGLTADIKNLGTDFKTVRTKAISTVATGYDLIDSLGNSSEGSDLEERLDSLNDSITNAKMTPAKVDEMLSELATVDSAVDSLQSKLTNTRNVKTTLMGDITALSSSLDSIASNLDSIKTKQEAIKQDIDSFNIKNAASIVNPITTTIEKVSTSKSRITFSFPYLLLLIVLFVGIMLSGTIVYMEKDSRAFFRTFTTPTRKIFFVWMTYLTSALLILLQVALVMIVVNLALDVPTFSNFGVTLLVLFLAMSVFIFLGMFIGHLFNSSEGITMATIAISSILIFLSNLILPIETLTPVMQGIINFNPYVIASEAIRKAMLFNAPLKSVLLDMVYLLVYVILIFVATMGAIKLSSIRFLQTMHIRAHKAVISVPEDHYLVIDNHDLKIKDMEDLLKTLQDMKDEDYTKLITPKNVFANWIAQTYKARGLALHMRTKHREKAIKVLEKYLKKKH